MTIWLAEIITCNLNTSNQNYFFLPKKIIENQNIKSSRSQIIAGVQLMTCLVQSLIQNTSYQAWTNHGRVISHMVWPWPTRAQINIQMLLWEISYQHDLNIERSPNQAEWMSLRLISPLLISTHQLYINSLSCTLYVCMKSK